MLHPSLADFLESLSQHGELARITAEVDPVLELGAISDRVAKAGGPALVFERVKGHHPVVVTNLLGTAGRICRALGVESFAEFVERIERLADSGGKPSWLDRLKLRSQESSFTRFAPKTVKVGPCQQVVKLGRDVNLAELPLLQSWPDEAARSITAGLVISSNPETGQRNVGHYTLAAVDGQRLALLVDPFRGLAADIASAQKRGEKLPVAIVLGGNAAVHVLADLPLAGLDPLVLVGVLAEQPLELVRCRTQPLDVPAGAEIVIEGLIDPAAAATPAPQVAAPSGFYQGRRCELSPVIEVSAVTHRTHAAYVATVFGPRLDETTALTGLVEQLLLPALRRVVPEVVDLALPTLAVQQGLVVVSVAKQYPGHAQRAAHAVWALPQLMLAKTVVVVDEHVPVRDIGEVLWRVTAHAIPERDLFFHTGPAHILDLAGGADGRGPKIGIDATAKLPQEYGKLPQECPHGWPRELGPSAATRELVERRWKEYGLPLG